MRGIENLKVIIEKIQVERSQITDAGQPVDPLF